MIDLKKFRKLLNKIWYDPVWSNLIANGIMAIIIYIFYRITSLSGKTATVQSSSPRSGPVPMHATVPEHPAIKETGDGTLLVYGGYIILFALVLFFVFRLIKGIVASKKKEIH